MKKSLLIVLLVFSFIESIHQVYAGMNYDSESIKGIESVCPVVETSYTNKNDIKFYKDIWTPSVCKITKQQLAQKLKSQFQSLGIGTNSKWTYLNSPIEAVLSVSVSIKEIDLYIINTELSIYDTVVVHRNSTTARVIVWQDQYIDTAKTGNVDTVINNSLSNVFSTFHLLYKSANITKN